MSALAISLSGLLLMIGGAVAGAGLRAVLPEHHLSKDSREIVSLCIGVVATMAALVLGLLIASAKDSFDLRVRETQQIAVSVVLLDQALRQYGPDSAAARKQLLAATTATLSHATTRGIAPPPTPLAARESLQALQLAVLALVPANDGQHWLKASALKLMGNLAQATEMLNLHEGSSLPMPFLVILVCWLVIIFGGIALYAPTNATVRAVLFVCALSTSGAIFLILEMDRPFDGWIQISSEPLSNAVAMVRQ